MPGTWPLKPSAGVNWTPKPRSLPSLAWSWPAPLSARGCRFFPPSKCNVANHSQEGPSGQVGACSSSSSSTSSSPSSSSSDDLSVPTNLTEVFTDTHWALCRQFHRFCEKASIRNLGISTCSGSDAVPTTCALVFPRESAFLSSMDLGLVTASIAQWLGLDML